MDFMFSECRIPRNFKLPDTFDTSAVKSMDHMFYEAVFTGKFDFGPAFIINPDVNTNLMFMDCVIGTDKIALQKCGDFEFVKSCLSN